MLNTKRLLEKEQTEIVLGKIKNLEMVGVISNSQNFYETYTIDYSDANKTSFQFMPTSINLTEFKGLLDSMGNSVGYRQLLGTVFPIEISLVSGTIPDDVAIMFLPNTNGAFIKNNIYTFANSLLNGYNIPEIDNLVGQNNSNDGTLVYFPRSGNLVRYFNTALSVNGVT